MITNLLSSTALTPAHSDRAHATLSASGAKRWIHCPGSVQLSGGLPDTKSEASDKGTAAHEVANMALEQQLPADNWQGTKVNDILITREMCASVQVYVDTCSEYMNGDWEFWVERKFSLEKLAPVVPIIDEFGQIIGQEPLPMFGTSDFVSLNRRLRKMVVGDYKNGFLFVDAAGNEQLRYYALGALYSFDVFPDIEEIEVFIVQPNSTGEAVKRDSFSIVDLIEWSLDLMDHARATLEPNAALHAGDWCKFCKAKGRCPEQARAAAESAQLDFDDLVDVAPGKELALPNHLLLTEEQLGYLVAYKLPALLEFAKAAQEAAHALMNRGIDIPYLKLVPKEARESWLNKDSVADDLKDTFGLPDAKVYAEPEAVSPAQARKNLAEVIQAAKKAAGEKITKKAAEEEARTLLKHLIEKKSSGTHVAPIEDHRPKVTGSVHQDFDALAAPEEN